MHYLKSCAEKRLVSAARKFIQDRALALDGIALAATFSRAIPMRADA